MMKNILAFILLISSFASAQNTVKAIMTPKLETDWVILYRVNGTKKEYVKDTKIKLDSLLINGEKKAVGTFNFTIPSYAEAGTYRINYSLKGATSVDFIYNKEDVSLIFNPNLPNETVAFTKSEENVLHKKYLKDISIVQQKLDSIQIETLQNPTIDSKENYKIALKNVDSVQLHYQVITKEKYIAPFIKAIARKNNPELLTSINDYMSNLKNSFFDNIDFSRKTLVNSSFLIDKTLEYVFYINYSDDTNTQQNLYKTAVKTVLSKITDVNYKKEIIEFLVQQFEGSQNLQLVDYLFENHYNKLPEAVQDNVYKKEKLALLAAEVGRIAPDFSWEEKGKKFKLSTLNDAESYVLVFWSTSCSHCLREIPQLHTYMKDKKDMKVIAFSLENDAFVWQNYAKTNLYGWHNVLGLKKWKNETARTYQVYSTPSYFILDKNKKIIAKPNEIKDVKEFLDKK